VAGEQGILDPAIAATVDRVMREAGLNELAFEHLASLGRAIREQAPGLFTVSPRDAPLEQADRSFFQPIDSSAMSDAQRELFEALMRGKLGHEQLRALLMRWAGHADPREPLDRMRFDCMRLQEILRRGALRVFGIDPPHCDEILGVIERLAWLQLGILASLPKQIPTLKPAAPSEPHFATFAERLRALIAVQQRAAGSALAVLVIDCGVVERIDAVWGFLAGESARSRLIQRLRNTVLRAGDVLSEFGRDDLICVLPGIPSPGVALLAAHKIMRVLGTPVRVDDGEIVPRPAIGIAIHPEHGDSPALLLQRAKIACQAALERPEHIAQYSEVLEHTQAESLAYESRLRAALDEGLLDLAFQPQFRLSDRRIAGVEGLLRWDDAELGAVEAKKTIAVAESAGLINEVSWWVLNNALRHCAEFGERGLRLPVSINLSPQNLLERDLPDFIDRGLRTWDLSPDRLVLEITENAMLSAAIEVGETLARLKDSGVRISLDHFGTGYSSMSSLSAIPLDELKIDRSFVHDLHCNAQHDRIVRSLIGLGHNLGLTVVAQGVEHEAVVERLAELECDRMQGFHAGVPLAARDFLARFAA
jgi:EAL domain-containing protein (putative c-di-GMP-specific phosphodiesterase class I)/GGDEF domain-containing protein